LSILVVLHKTTVLGPEIIIYMKEGRFILKKLRVITKQ